MERPRQHVLETMSKAAFRGALPDLWVTRDQDQDYGIDAEVEIFDNAGHSTGLIFKVQLKSTEDLPASIQVKIKHLKYWSSMPVPVMIVLYVASTDQLFVKWVNALGVEPP